MLEVPKKCLVMSKKNPMYQTNGEIENDPELESQRKTGWLQVVDEGSDRSPHTKDG